MGTKIGFRVIPRLTTFAHPIDRDNYSKAVQWFCEKLGELNWRQFLKVAVIQIAAQQVRGVEVLILHDLKCCY